MRLSPGWASTFRSVIGVLPTSVDSRLFSRSGGYRDGLETGGRTRRRLEVCHGLAQQGLRGVSWDRLPCARLTMSPPQNWPFCAGGRTISLTAATKTRAQSWYSPS